MGSPYAGGKPPGVVSAWRSRAWQGRAGARQEVPALLGLHKGTIVPPVLLAVPGPCEGPGHQSLMLQPQIWPNENPSVWRAGAAGLCGFGAILSR